MPTRKAHARWEGSLKEGEGKVDFGNGAFKGAYSFVSRFEEGAGTNPEELLGAAHAKHLIRISPLVVVPAHDLDQITIDDLGELEIDDGCTRIADDVRGDERVTRYS